MNSKPILKLFPLPLWERLLLFRFSLGILGFAVVTGELPSQTAVRPNMSLPPEVGSVKPYRVPPRDAFRLKNGLEILFVKDSRFPLLNVRLGIRPGARVLKAKEAGLADALAELLTEGTSVRSAREIAEAMDDIGGVIYASASPDHFVIGASCLSEFAESLFQILQEVTLHPSFPEEEVALRRQNMLEELRLNRSQAGFLGQVVFHKKLYEDHPYAILAPTEDSIQRVQRDRLVELRNKLFLPNASVLVVVGDADPQNLRGLAEKYLGAWAPGERAPAESDRAPKPGRRQVYLVDRPSSAQTEIQLGNLAVTETHPDYFPLLVLNGILGGSFSSRLVSDIRESKGYAYRIRTRIVPQLELGAFTLNTQVRTEVTQPALQAILGHLEGIRQKPVTQEELDQAKNFLSGSFVRGLETQEDVADAWIRIKLNDLPEDFLSAYVQKVQEVTVERVTQASLAHIHTDKLVIVAVGDAARIRKELSEFSSKPVRLLDENGD